MYSLKTAIAVLALASLGLSAAHAKVVYNWHPVDPGPVITGVSGGQKTPHTEGGKIIVTDAAYQSGSASIDYAPPYDESHLGGPHDELFVDSPITYASIFFGHDPSYANLNEPGPNALLFSPLGGDIKSDLTFLPSGRLSGSLAIYNGYTDYQASGDGDLWHVPSVKTDYLNMVCNEEAPCPPGGFDAGTGYWQLDPASVQVPAPGPWWLYFAGVIAALGLARHRWPGGDCQ